MTCNIYFAGSIGGGREDAGLYFRIIQQLKAYGRVFTEHVASPNIETGEKRMKVLIPIFCRRTKADGILKADRLLILMLMESPSV